MSFCSDGMRFFGGDLLVLELVPVVDVVFVNEVNERETERYLLKAKQ